MSEDLGPVSTPPTAPGVSSQTPPGASGVASLAAGDATAVTIPPPGGSGATTPPASAYGVPEVDKLQLQRVRA